MISAALLATLGSLAPMSAQPSQSSQPASPSSPPAQPAQPQTAGATPPALPPNFPVPTDSGKPDLTYTQQKSCVASQDAGVVLHNKPWGQLQLDFDTRVHPDHLGLIMPRIEHGIAPWWRES